MSKLSCMIGVCISILLAAGGGWVAVQGFISRDCWGGMGGTVVIILFVWIARYYWNILVHEYDGRRS